MKKKIKTSNVDQAGVVSILVSVIIMIILTLIVVSFAQIMRREQRQSLDRQLSSQAYYAAESAINDATNSYAKGEITDSFDSCKQSSGPLSGNVLNTELEVSYSCVTLSKEVESVEFDSVDFTTRQFRVDPVDSAGTDQSLKDLVINWQTANKTSFATTTEATTVPGNLPIPSEWPTGRPGLIRIEIIPLEKRGGAIFDRNKLIDSRRVYWLYPSSGNSNTIDWSSTTNNGQMFEGNCDTSILTRSKNCQVVIQNFVDDTDLAYILRVKSIYSSSSMKFEGVLHNSSTAIFKNSQISIDATGKANDVLRRIRAKISVEDSYPVPDNAIQAYDGLCKQLSIVNQDEVKYNCPN